MRAYRNTLVDERTGVSEAAPKYLGGLLMETAVQLSDPAILPVGVGTFRVCLPVIFVPVKSWFLLSALCCMSFVALRGLSRAVFAVIAVGFVLRRLFSVSSAFVHSVCLPLLCRWTVQRQIYSDLQADFPSPVSHLRAHLLQTCRATERHGKGTP